MDDTNGVIISAVVLTVGSGVVVSATKGNAPAFNSFLAGGFMGGFLFAVALVSEDLARLFSYLIILGVLLRNGDALFGWINRNNAVSAVKTKPSSLGSLIPNSGVAYNA